LEKKKYRVDLNWHGEVKTYYRYAPSENQALSFACIALGKETGYDPLYVRKHVISKPQGWEVKEEKK